MVRKLALETNRVVLMVLHDLNQVLLYADRIALLSRGSYMRLVYPAKFWQVKTWVLCITYQPCSFHIP